jgi:hypothetical protein
MVEQDTDEDEEKEEKERERREKEIERKERGVWRAGEEKTRGVEEREVRYRGCS